VLINTFFAESPLTAELHQRASLLKMLPANTAFHVVFEFQEAGDVKTAKAHDASTANVDETLRRANFHRLIHELAGAVKATNDVHRNKHLTKALNKAREAGIALLGSNGGTDLRALIYHRLDALLGALGVPYKLIGRIDGDVAGPCEDEFGHMVIIDSRDRDFALIGAVRWSANQSLWIIRGFKDGVITACDGFYAHLCLMCKLFPLTVEAMRVAGVPLWVLAAPYSVLAKDFPQWLDAVLWMRLLLCACSEFVEPATVTKAASRNIRGRVEFSASTTCPGHSGAELDSYWVTRSRDNETGIALLIWSTHKGATHTTARNPTVTRRARRMADPQKPKSEKKTTISDSLSVEQPSTQHGVACHTSHAHN